MSRMLETTLLMLLVGGCDTLLERSSEHAGGATPAPFDAKVPLVGTNTNTCLVDLGQLADACPEDGALDLPNSACCAAFEAFQRDGCSCSPVLRKLMGTNDEGVSQLDRAVDGLGGFCPALGFDEIPMDCTAERTLSGIASGAGHTYNDGQCELSDREIDSERLESVFVFNRWFDNYGGEPSGCVDYDTLSTELGKAFDADAADGKTPYIDVPYGIGRYKTLKDMAEYLAIILPDINKDAWRFLMEKTRSDDSMLHFSSDGDTIILGTRSVVRGYKDCVDSAKGYYEMVARYEGCSPTMNSVKIPLTSEVSTQKDKVTAVPEMVSGFYQVGLGTDTWGAMDICMTHELHCTGENQQFESYDACMAFITGLPEVSPACAEEGKILGGDSQLCRFKHHFMIPFEPAAHCFHIGKGMADTHGHTKCTDLECEDPEVLGGPMELLSLKPSPALAECFSRADAASTTADGGPKSPWATAQVCKSDKKKAAPAAHHHGG